MNRLVVNADIGEHTINRHIYGHFSEHLGRCIYGGYWVGEDSEIPNVRGIRRDVVDALRAIRIPNLRWPGGCFADDYHWMDGIGPREKRPSIVNIHWGGVTENNHFGTHEFLDLCQQLGCEPYICGNVGSGTVRELSQWVEYVNCPAGSPMSDLRASHGRREPWAVKFWGVGNENWGCGGHMRADYYADEARRYGCFMRNYGENRVFKIACGACGDGYEWTDVLMRQARQAFDGLALHHYCGSGKKSRSATQFDEQDWFTNLKQALYMDELIVRHSAIMDRYDPDKRVWFVVDEWGTWHAVEPGTNPGFLYQQNSLRDALVAALTLNVFNTYCERVKLCNIAQTVNVLQAMVLTDGARMIRTPTYHVFQMYTVHHDATMLPAELTTDEYRLVDESIPMLHASASRNAEGKMHVSLCNTHPAKAADLQMEVRGAAVRKVAGRVLTAPKITSHNTFDKPDAVRPAVFDKFRRQGNRIAITMPSKSVVVLEIA
jgi:alpha-N-arabinofuranosidase